MGDTDPHEHVRRVAAVFDRAAEGYDSPAMRFFPFAADRLTHKLHPAAGDKVLDVCAGTGAATLALAQAVGPQGRVFAIDLSEAMLAKLDEKRRKFGIEQIDVHVMDASRPEFRRDYFHHVVSAFGIFFMPDMAAALREWVRVLRPGGRLMFTAFTAGAFEPYKAMFFERLKSFGVDPGQAMSPAQKLYDPDECRRLAEAAGLQDVQVETEQLGYHLRNAQDWWEIVWFTGLRNFVQNLAPEALEAFRAAHLAEIDAQAGPDGIWLDVGVHFTRGNKAAGRNSGN